MSIFLRWMLPMPVVAQAGATEDLSTMLTRSFGSLPNGWTDLWLTYYPPPQYAEGDSSYWNLANPAVATWSVNGVDIGDGLAHQTHVGAASIGNVLFHAGNNIAPVAYLTVPSGTAGSEYIQYNVPVVDPHVLSPVAGLGAPTPQDIVDTAYRFESFYSFVPNPADCGNIAIDIAAATGATLTP